MPAFIIRFLICNIFISFIIGIIFLIKQILKNSLTNRMQYNLWFILLVLLTVPFIRIKPVTFLSFFSLMEGFKILSGFQTETISNSTVTTNQFDTSNWMNDFALSVSNESHAIGIVLTTIWIIGIFTMVGLIIKSAIRENTLLKSALPLQSKEVLHLYKKCLDEMKITRNIPIYSTAFLKSPVIVGLCKPRIYIPIHLISNYNVKDMKYMLLHELQHFRHKDALANYLMNIAASLYWFNPFVWCALKEMRNDREVACDTSVLKMLKEDDYEDYGNTLISLAEKISLTPFPFTTSISGNMKQMKRRVLNISYYEKPSFQKIIKCRIAYLLTIIVLLGFAPILSTYAEDDSHYQWNTNTEHISYVDLSGYFDKYDGSFVLYDLESDTWNIYDVEYATTRVSPNSTFKIYSALFGLEEGMITPKDSLLMWDRKRYPFEEWNRNHDLFSAMDASVNWYFQTIDAQLGYTTVHNYIQKIEYGNENISGNFSTYWMEASLKISPIEQVELMKGLYNNDFDFARENIDVVKESILLTSSENGNLYGKTGTGRVNNQDVNGWFVGYVESESTTHFFALNIQSDADATGSNATDIALSILSDMNIWK